MTPNLALLEFYDFAIIAVIVIVFAGGTAYSTRQVVRLGGLQRRLDELQRKMDALLKHQGIEVPAPPPSGLSPEVEELASSPDRKLEAIRLYRQENPGVGLAEAKKRIEAFAESQTKSS
jgi:hypothetical protein